MSEAVAAATEEAVVRREVEVARFEILADAIRILAKASGFKDPELEEFLEHNEYGLAYDELADHVAADRSVLTAHQNGILDEVRQALHVETGSEDGDFHAAARHAQVVAMKVLYECVLSKTPPGDRMRKSSDFTGLLARWTRLRPA